MCPALDDLTNKSLITAHTTDDHTTYYTLTSTGHTQRDTHQNAIPDPTGDANSSDDVDSFLI